MRIKMSIIIVIFWLSMCACDAFPSMHHLITPEERMEIFGTEEPPEHEVVPITITKLHKRAAVKIPNYEKMHLSCIRMDGMLAGKEMPIYEVHNYSNVLRIENPKSLKNVEFYANPTEATTLAACNLINRQTITGVIRKKRLAIRPLPEHIVERIIKHRRSLDNVTEDENHQYHLVIKMPESSDIKFNNIKRSKRDITPERIYPEILVIVDNWLYRGLRDHLVPYILSYWLAVDLIYRELYQPEIRLNIAAIYIAMDKNALNYMVPKQVFPKIDDPSYDIELSLDRMGRWLYNLSNGTILRTFDVAFTMTLADLYKGSNQIDGISHQSGACKDDHAARTTNKVAIIKNDGAFDRIITGAYELGHLLGAAYDNGGGCPSQLPPPRDNAYGRLVWPICTLRLFKNYLSSNKSSCLHNKPNPGDIVPIDLPGWIMSADQQCQRLGYNGFVANSKYMCDTLSCYSKNWTAIYTNVPAATGTPCGTNRSCFHKRCIDD